MSQPCIFVVEDEASFVDALQIGLSREGFHVEIATDGIEAIDWVREGYERTRELMDAAG